MTGIPEHPDIAVLHDLLTAGSVLGYYRNRKRMLEFALAAMRSIPGIDEVRITEAGGEPGDKAMSITLTSGSHTHGAVVFRLQDAAVFDHYRAALHNFSTTLALRIEALDQQELMEQEIERTTRDLRFHRRFLQSMFDSTSDPMAVYDHNGRIVRLNRAARDMIGRDPDHPGGLRDGVFWRAYRGSDPIAEVLRAGEPLERTVELPLPEGGVAWYSVSLLPMAEGADYVIETAREVSELKRLQEELSEALGQRDLLLREVHHRVKNNLHVVASVLRLQFQDIDDPRVQRGLASSIERVETIALVHGQLQTAENHETVNAATFFASLANDLAASYAGDHRIDLSGAMDSVTLSSRQATSAGLIMNELLANAFKYAYPDGAGVVRVGLSARNRAADGARQVELSVADEGVGMPGVGDGTRSGSLGMTVVEALTAQLDGSVEFAATREDAERPGLTVRIVFPVGSEP